MFDDKKPAASERLLPILGPACVEPLFDGHAAAVLGVQARGGMIFGDRSL
jgi:hypothetical protein